MTESFDLLFKAHGYVSDGGQYLLLHFCQDDLKLHEFFFVKFFPILAYIGCY